MIRDNQIDVPGDTVLNKHLDFYLNHRSIWTERRTNQRLIMFHTEIHSAKGQHGAIHLFVVV